jgi:DNA transformation protein
MSTVSQDLTELRNIGPTIRKRLNEIGVRDRADLERLGSVEAYRKICRKYPAQTIPVCYYLYSLEGALMDKHWDALPKSIKDALYTQAKGKRN